MSFLVLNAYWKLIYFDLYLARGSFSALYKKVRNYPLRKQSPSPEAIERICYAVDMACIWYWKEVLCLQRSAAGGGPPSNTKCKPCRRHSRCVQWLRDSATVFSVDSSLPSCRAQKSSRARGRGRNRSASNTR